MRRTTSNQFRDVAPVPFAGAHSRPHASPAPPSVAPGHAFSRMRVQAGPGDGAIGSLARQAGDPTRTAPERDAARGILPPVAEARGPAPAPPGGVLAQLGPGEPLPQRDRWERVTAADLSTVRVHRGAGAAAATGGLRARALTVGEHIAFGPGRYAPGTGAGDRLLRHELAHVLQQRGGTGSRVQLAPIQEEDEPDLVSSIVASLATRLATMAEEYHARRRLERAETQLAAAAVLQARNDGLVLLGDVTQTKKGKLTVIREGLISQQLREIATARDDQDIGHLIQLGTARMLQRMVDSAHERRRTGVVEKGSDFSIYSLGRPNAGPHTQGAAIDIGRYAGKPINFNQGRNSSDAVAAFYRDMIGAKVNPDDPKGPLLVDQPSVATGIRLGLPRQPKTDPAGIEVEKQHHWDKKQKHYDVTRIEVPKVRPPLRPVIEHYRLKPRSTFDPVFLPREDPVGGQLEAKDAIARFQDPTVRQSFERIREADVDMVMKDMFPDAWDHLHAEAVRR